MKQLIVILSVLALMSATAHAEHKLLVTDVLNKGQSEISAEVSYFHSKYDFSDRSTVNPSGTARTDSTASTFYTATGLGHGLQISASIPYLFSQKTTFDFDTTPPASDVSKRDGLGDLKIGVKYRIVGEETAPVTLVTGLDLKFDMQGTKHGGTGTTNIAPYLALSRKYAPETRLYASYAAVLRNHGAADSHLLVAGVEQGVSRRVTAVAEVVADFLINNDHLKDTEEFGGTLATYLQLYGNLYLIPSVQAFLVNSFDQKDSSTHFGPTRAIGATMRLYYLF
jgi:hypothetical protein